jgi:hypothetical protein
MSPLRSGDAPNGRSPTHFCTSELVKSLGGLGGNEARKIVAYDIDRHIGIFLLYFKSVVE